MERFSITTDRGGSCPKCCGGHFRWHHAGHMICLDCGNIWNRDRQIAALRREYRKRLVRARIKKWAHQ